MPEKSMFSLPRVGFMLALAASFLGLAGCAGTGGLPAAPAVANAQDYTYIIGPGDNLNIVVWRNPELTTTVPVRPDGKISTPLVDELVAQGKTSADVAREIEKVLGKYVRDPVVTVVVTSFVGPYSEQIRVVGEAAISGCAQTLQRRIIKASRDKGAHDGHRGVDIRHAPHRLDLGFREFRPGFRHIESAV